MIGNITEEADRAAEVFFRAVERMAERDPDGTLQVLSEFTGPDDLVAAQRAWGLATIAPLITAHVMRRHFADQIPAGSLWTVESFSALPIEQTVEASALTAVRVLVEHLNNPLGAGTDVTVDMVAAHAREHGPEGVGALVIELLNVAAFLWREGAFETKGSGQ